MMNGFYRGGGALRVRGFGRGDADIGRLPERFVLQPLSGDDV